MLIAITEEPLLHGSNNFILWLPHCKRQGVTTYHGKEERSNSSEVRKQCWKVLENRLPKKGIGEADFSGVQWCKDLAKDILYMHASRND